MMMSLLAVAYALVSAAAALCGVVVWRSRQILPTSGPLVVAALGLVGSNVPLFLDAVHGRAPTTNAFTIAASTLLLTGCVGLGLRMVDQSRSLDRMLLLLWIDPLVVGVAAATNEHAHLLLADLPEDAVVASPAPVGALHVAYSLLLTVVAVGVVLRRARRDRIRLARVLLALLAVLLPLTLGVAASIALAVGDAAYVPMAALSGLNTLLLAAVSQAVFRLLPIARAKIVNSIEDAVVVLDADGLVVTANPPARALLAVLAPADVRLDGAPLPGVVTALAPTTADRTTFDVDVPGTGEHYEVRVTVLRGRRGHVLGRTLVARNVTATRENQRELERFNDALQDQVRVIEALRRDLAEQASRDALTGLHNRRYLMEVLADSDVPLALAVLDVDHFKQVNDVHGHPAGDEVLRAVASRLAAGLTTDDVLARYGGEEFVVAFRGASLDEAQLRIDALRRAVAADPIVVEPGIALTVTFSAGVAVGADPGDLLTRADLALYEAKRGGRNRVEAARQAGKPSSAAALAGVGSDQRSA